jgi:hypothetical protein
MKNILNEISSEEKRRILEMHKSHLLREQIEQGTIDAIKVASDFVQKFQNKKLNFYFPQSTAASEVTVDATLPIVNGFMCSKVSFDEVGSKVFFDGTVADIGEVRLSYLCDGTNIFSLEIRKFNNNILNSLANLIDVGIDDNWKKLIGSYAQMKVRTVQKVGGEIKKEKHRIYNELINAFPRELVEGGIDGDGKEMIEYIQNYLCSINKQGKAVPKANFASTNTQTNQNMS